jgi:tetratricopeptide (TPR) repeat protein/transcriptional regulator with XRE-family HTH domain
VSMSNAPDSFGALLQAFRHRRQLTQQQVADKLGVHRNTIGTWERGDFLPESKGLVLELARSLRLNDEEGRRLLEASFTAPAPFWSVHFPRNPLFTGREEMLEILHTCLGSEPLVALTQSYALHGLGGVGKTQLVLEYAYQHALEYSAVGWIAAETTETVVSSLLRVAEHFQLPDWQDTDQQRVVAAVQRWLSIHSQWLLIWDNLEDLGLLPHFLPSLRQGSVLITTRSQALGSLAHGVDLCPMGEEEGRLLLLRRAKMLSPQAPAEQMRKLVTSRPTEYAAAGDLVSVLGGLPLALDQAGAYIEETGCSLSDYLHRYSEQRVRLLERRGGVGSDHPQSVMTTFQLALEQVDRKQKAAADVLRVCAFVYAEGIPEELFILGAEHLGPALAPLASDPTWFDQAVAVLRSLSLVQRQPETHTLSLHRLVQAVIREPMSEQEQVVWLKRVLKSLNVVFPAVRLETAEVRKQAERFLPHVLPLVDLLPDQEGGQELAEALQNAAQYLRVRAQYEQAETMYQRAIRVKERVLGPEHLQVATSLNGLGQLYWEQGKYEQAEPLFQRALAIYEQQAGPDYPQVASLLENLAALYAEQGNYELAEPLFQRVVSMREQAMGSGHAGVAVSLANLADCYADQGKYEQAEPLYQRALAIWDQTLGREHSYAAHSLSGLARLYTEQGKYEEAEPLFQQALTNREQHLGQHHPQTAETLYDLAILRQKQGNLNEALSLAKDALQICSEMLGEAHPKTLAVQTLYAQLLQEQEHTERDGTPQEQTEERS